MRVTTTNSTAFSGNGTYILTFIMNVTVGSGPGTVSNTPSWLFYMTNISLFPLWNSSLNLVSYSGNVTAGQITTSRFYYYTSNSSNGNSNVSIPDARVMVYNANTSNIWGLDNGVTPKYQVINYNNGIYDIQINSVGYAANLYNISVEFRRNNFPDTYWSPPLQLNITGSPANITCTGGASYNSTYLSWVVLDANTPYVNDTSKFVQLYVTDTITHAGVSGAFVEISRGVISLTYADLYLTSGGNPTDKGYYDVYLDTTNLPPVSAPNYYNFSITVTAVNYSASIINFSTLVDPLPTALTLSNIPPFYTGSAFILTATFEDTFHNTGVDDANLFLEHSWAEFQWGITFYFSRVLPGYRRPRARFARRELYPLGNGQSATGLCRCGDPVGDHRLAQI